MVCAALTFRYDVMDVDRDIPATNDTGVAIEQRCDRARRSLVAAVLVVWVIGAPALLAHRLSATCRRAESGSSKGACAHLVGGSAPFTALFFGRLTAPRISYTQFWNNRFASALTRAVQFVRSHLRRLALHHLATHCARHGNTLCALVQLRMLGPIRKVAGSRAVFLRLASRSTTRSMVIAVEWLMTLLAREVHSSSYAKCGLDVHYIPYVLYGQVVNT